MASRDSPSIISADLTIRGSLSTERNVQLDGRVEGDILAAGLTLGQKAFVEGNVYADEAIISGHVRGTIFARVVHLTATADVAGDIVHDRNLSIERGASFQGSSRHSENPRPAKTEA
jgi:cytoskeletal protein CcmA (bactofilin family)